MDDADEAVQAPWESGVTSERVGEAEDGEGREKLVAEHQRPPVLGHGEHRVAGCQGLLVRRIRL